MSFLLFLTMAVDIVSEKAKGNQLDDDFTRERESCLELHYLCRAVGRSENPGVTVLFGGHNLLPPPYLTQFEIGLTDLCGWHGTPRDDTPANKMVEFLVSDHL